LHADLRRPEIARELQRTVVARAAWQQIAGRVVVWPRQVDAALQAGIGAQCLQFQRHAFERRRSDVARCAIEIDVALEHDQLANPIAIRN